jgi:hypothetical protein
MSFVRLGAIMALTIFISKNSFAVCDMYEYKRDLQSGYEISLNNSCSTRNIKELASVAKERITVQLLGFSLTEAKEIADSGVLLETSPRIYTYRILQQIANISGPRLKANMNRMSYQDVRDISAAGSSLVMDSSFSSYDVVEACQKVILPAKVEVFTRGFSGFELEDIGLAGCTLVDVNQNNLHYYEAEKILSKGGRLEIGTNFSGFEVRKLAALAKERVTVELPGFSSYDARQIALQGANVNLDKSFSGFDTREICKLVKAPAVGRVHKRGYTDYDLRKIVEAGCKIYY